MMIHMVLNSTQVEGQLSSRVDQFVLRWFGDVERIYEERMDKVVMISDVQGNKCRGRPRLGWMDGVKMTLGERSTSVEQGTLNALDRRRWELIVTCDK